MLDYKVFKNKEDIIQASETLLGVSEFVFDLETTGLNTHAEDLEIVGMGFAWKKNHAIYIPINYDTGLSFEEIIELFRDPLESDNIGVVGQNIKYDARVCRRFGIKINNITFDTYVAHYCLFGDRFRHNLDDISMQHINIKKIRTKSLIPKKSKKNPNPSMKDMPVDDVGYYCMEDVDTTLQLTEYFRSLFKLPEYEYAKEVFYKMELPLLPVLIDMECEGAYIDEDFLDQLEEKYRARVELYSKYIFKAAGEEFSINSPVQLGKVLFDDLQIHTKLGVTVPKTSLGNYKTDVAILEKLEKDKVIRALLKVKKYQKLLKTYVTGIRNAISPVTGLIHASFNQCKVATGRLSSSSPNLQNCIDGDSEILTKNGWIKIKDYTPGDQVAQWDKGIISFVNPTNYIKQKDTLISITTRSTKLLCTPEHRCPLYNRRNNFKVFFAKDYPEDHKQIHAGKYFEGKLELDPDLLRLIVATQADGYYSRKFIDFKFSKQRKVKRLIEILDKLKANYRISLNSNNATRIVLKDINLIAAIKSYLGNDKVFSNWILELTYDNLQIFTDELFYWDGSYTRKNNYASAIKQNTDWVQIAFSLMGKRARIRKYVNSSDSVSWQVDITNKDYTFTTNRKISPVSGIHDVYCITVPSSYFLMRKDNCVIVTGNCPQRTEEGKNIRKLFVSRWRDEGGKILACDLSQAELRILAHYANDKTLIDAFKNNEDVHDKVAIKTFKLPEDQPVPKDLRSRAKIISFGLVYGMKATKLSRDFGVTKEEAQKIIDEYLDSMPGVKQFLSDSEDFAYANGYTETLCRRRRYSSKVFSSNILDQWSGGRELTNFLIQGLNADMIKIAMVKIHDQFNQRNLKSIMFSQVHDEVVIDLHPDEIEIVPEIVKECMENSVRLNVTVLAEGQVADNWSDAH